MKRILHGAQGRAAVREGRAVIDAADWTPDNLSAGETGGGVVADDVILEGRGWEEVRVVAFFNGAKSGAETTTVQPLRSIRVPGAAPGREWVPEGAALVLAPHGTISAVIPADADLAFRATALTLGTATSLTLFVTGGKRVRPRS